jgi:hypothetical protein
MRVIGLTSLCLALFFGGCGANSEAPDTASKSTTAAWKIDGFLNLLPANTSITLRMPLPSQLATMSSLLTLTGHDTSAPYLTANGLDPDRAGAISFGTDNSWVRYLPAKDKGAINAELREHADRMAVREEGDWMVLGTGGAAKGSSDPLPPGDIAIRVQNHALLDAIAQPGDRLELGITLRPGGLEAAGRLIPGDNSPTIEAVTKARGAVYGRIDLLPAWMAIRIETTMPPTLLARSAARRIARHTGLEEGDLRDNIERFLREAATGIDPESGYAIGIDCKEGALSFAVVGRIADGPASPVLAKLLRDGRDSFGGLTLDEREVKGKSLRGYFAWVPQATANASGLPTTALALLGNLVDEDVAVPVTYAEDDGIAVVTAGKASDSIARAILKRVRAGMQRSTASSQAASMRQEADGECVWIAAVSGRRLASLASADIAALRAIFHAGETASAPKLIVVAGFRRETGTGIGVRARVLY